MMEKRLVERLKRYWEKLGDEQHLPLPNKLNPEPIRDLWPYCLKLEIVPGKRKNTLYVYRYMGAEITRAYGSDLTGQYVNTHMHNFPGWQILESLDDMNTLPTVQVTEGHFINDQQKVIKYRACCLPFGDDTTVTHILVGLSWREF